MAQQVGNENLEFKEEKKGEGFEPPVKYFYQGLKINECQTFEFTPINYTDLAKQSNIKFLRYSQKAGRYFAHSPLGLKLAPLPKIVKNATILWVGMASPRLQGHDKEIQDFTGVKGLKCGHVGGQIAGQGLERAMKDCLDGEEFIKLDAADYKNYSSLLEKGMDGIIIVGCITSDSRTFSLRFVKIEQFFSFVKYHCAVAHKMEMKDNETDSAYRIRMKKHVSSLLDECFKTMPLRKYFFVADVPMLDMIDNNYNCKKLSKDSEAKLDEMTICLISRPMAVAGGITYEDFKCNSNNGGGIGCGSAVFMSSEVSGVPQGQAHDFGQSFEVSRNWFAQDGKFIKCRSYLSAQFSFLVNVASYLQDMSQLAGVLQFVSTANPETVLIENSNAFTAAFQRSIVVLAFGNMAICSTWFDLRNDDGEEYYENLMTPQHLFGESEIEAPER